jgi:hypothetical protein
MMLVLAGIGATVVVLLAVNGLAALLAGLDWTGDKK